MIRFDFDSISIWFKKRFDSIWNYISSEERKLGTRRNANFQTNCPLWKHIYLTVPFKILFCGFLVFFPCRSWRFFMFRFLSRSNHIEKVIWFDLNSIRFEQKHSIRKHNTIQFRFNLTALMSKQGKKSESVAQRWPNPSRCCRWVNCFQN